MELEEMKTLWSEMSAELEKQKKLTDLIIIKMTQANYRSKINGIFIPEVIGSFICLAMGLYILVNFYKLNSLWMALCGAAGVLILFILPVLSLRAIHTLRSVNILRTNYKQSLKLYAKGKLQFVFVQKLSFYLGAVMMLVLLPPVCVIMGVKDPFSQSSLWLSYVVMFPLFYFLARWVFRKYMSVTGNAENILKELDK
jgi:hypothetical protein